MRIFRAAAFGLATVLLAFGPASAQQSDRPEGFASFNLAVEDGPRYLTVAVPAPIFETAGTIDVDDHVAGATMMDVSGGVRGRRFACGAGLSRSHTVDSYQFTASTAPAVPGGFTRSLQAVTPGLEHHERVVYVFASLVHQFTNHLDLMVSGGPAFFNVSQALPLEITQGPMPYGDFESMETTVVERSAVGFHGALDFNYLFNQRLGFGVLLRYSYGSVDLPDSTRSMTLGGIQIGTGLRARF